MCNVLKVNEQEAIRSLHEKGWSRRKIARELGVNRRTVSRYAAARCGISSACDATREGSKCTISTAGPEGRGDSKCTISTAGSGGVDGAPGAGAEGGRAGSGRQSLCAALAEAIGAKLEAGLSAQRIWQDLVEESGFGGSYESVKRYVRRRKERHPRRVWRVECQPGEEMQVDFGLGAPIETGDGKTRRSWVLRAVLGYSRKGYSEAVLRQDTETFLRCLENALRHFGGAPLLLNLDNLKAGVIKADWFDPEINPKLADFCRHYSMHPMPCRPGIPRHKGKVERGVGYVRSNALRGRRFASLGEENALLASWERNVADKRVHGTTCKQVAALFEEERPHLQALPASLFPCYREARRGVNRDSFVEVERAFYEAPPEYIGRQLWVRWDSRCVRLFNERMEQVQIHARIEPGRFSRALGAAGMSAPVLRSCRWWIDRAALIGEACSRWAKAAVDARGPEALRAVMGLCRLADKHTAEALDAACARALERGARRLRDVQRLLGGDDAQPGLPFAERHPLIRDLKIYSEFVQPQCTTQQHEHGQHQTTRPDLAPLGAA